MTNAFTVDAWVNPTGNGATDKAMIFNKEGEYELARDASTGRLMWAVANAANSWAWMILGILSQTNTWTHVAMTFSNGAISIYANGALVHTGSITSSTIGDALPSSNDFESEDARITPMEFIASKGHR